MALRISEQTRYGAFINQTNQALAKLMDLSMQESSQKRINAPSDDPAGTSRVLSYRDTLSAINQYNKNVSTAQGWLKAADDTMLLVSNNITRLLELTEQAATSSVNATNRQEIAAEVRHVYEQLINEANTTYDGQHVFSGHKVDSSAYVKCLGLTSNDPAITDDSWAIQGDSDKTILMQWTSDGAVGTDALDYRYTTDGGATWQTGSLAAGDNVVSLGGVTITLNAGTQISAVDTTVDSSKDNGTWMWVRPSAVYQGDVNNANDVNIMGSADVTGQAQGVFKSNVIVRIDNAAPVGLDGTIEYSYSTDGGMTWTTGNKVDTGTADQVALPVPGGFLYLDSASGAGNELNPGDQIIIHPSRADIALNISDGEYIVVNNVGLDIFGGLFKTPGSDSPGVVNSNNNLFETVGRLIGYLETNNQDGIQRALDELNGCQEHIMVKEAGIGARENRLTYIKDMLTINKETAEGQLSRVEDVDLVTLLSEISKQNLIYESVLKSTSMVMRTSLLNYL